MLHVINNKNKIEYKICDNQQQSRHHSDALIDTPFCIEEVPVVYKKVDHNL